MLSAKMADILSRRRCVNGTELIRNLSIQQYKSFKLRIDQHIIRDIFFIHFMSWLFVIEADLFQGITRYHRKYVYVRIVRYVT